MGAQLSHNQKQERVQICSDIIAAVHHQPKSILHCVVTVDEIMVCYHAPETKNRTNSGFLRARQVP